MWTHWVTQIAWPDVLAVLGTIRQLRYPREHRIGTVRMPPGAKQAVHTLLQRGMISPSPVTTDTTFITDLCLMLWRIDQRLAKIHRGDDPPELGRLTKHFEDLQDVLREAHIDIHDYTGQRHDVGLGVRVLTYQPTAGVTAGQEIILETVKPTVYQHGRLIAPGEVVVGIPMSTGGKRDGV